MVELLAPAGDLQRAKIALVYGADAVYIGGKQFSLRARASNFTLENIKEACDFAHSLNKKVYVTVNIIPHNSDFEGLKEYLIKLDEFGVDGIICASRAILALAKQVCKHLEVHISTQQTTTNSLAVSYWQKLGADRLVLAREVSLEEMELIMHEVSLPIEVFIHGGMCANYSGRCTISNLLTNRDANRGGCAQSCRWNYNLYHNDQNLNNSEHLLSMGSKDMCAVDYIESILKLNVASLKIEGRMKTAYYIANVVKGYRYLIDAFNEKGYISQEELAYGKSLLARVANRETFPGFYPGEVKRDGQLYETVSTVSQNYVASIVSYENGKAIVETRNNFKKNDQLALMRPEGKDKEFVVSKMLDEQGQEVEVANKPMQKLLIDVPCEVDEYCFIKLKER